MDAAVEDLQCQLHPELEIESAQQNQSEPASGHLEITSIFLIVHAEAGYTLAILASNVCCGIPEMAGITYEPFRSHGSSYCILTYPDYQSM